MTRGRDAFGNIRERKKRSDVNISRIGQRSQALSHERALSSDLSDLDAFLRNNPVDGLVQLLQCMSHSMRDLLVHFVRDEFQSQEPRH